MGEKRMIEKVARMPMIAMRGLVLFPQMVLHFDIGRDKSVAALNAVIEGNRRIFLTAQKEMEVDEPGFEDVYQIGTVAEVKSVIRLRDTALRLVVEGVYRAKITKQLAVSPYFEVQVKSLPTRRVNNEDELVCATVRTVKNLFEGYAQLSPKMPKEIMMGVALNDDAAFLSEFVAANIDIPIEEKQEILEQSDILNRLDFIAQILDNENDILRLEKQIYDKVKNNMDQNQRDYYLREQIKVLSEELGEESPDVEVDNYLSKIAELNLDIESATKLTKEANRLLKMSSSSQEAAVIRGYLDTCLELPWNKKSKIKSDVKAAQTILDNDHYGMKKVKERIIETIAVRSLAPDMKGQILCLVGPPGVGKTSIAKSIAKATGREYVRISLGGVRDESDIRGHRKTYIGSMPGRIIDAMKRAGTKNPLVLLDEVDKMSSDFKGDPSSALLEVLDGEQNHAFRDHFIELPFDLSEVLFVATANDADAIATPLYDRMEVIRLSSYTREEKLNIAKRHLVAKQRERHGLKGAQIRISDEALYAMIDGYTHEAGVRKLEQTIASVMRKAAKKIVAGEQKRVVVNEKLLLELLGPKRRRPDDIADKGDEVGVANGLAWTSVGGEMMEIEATVLEGSGKLELTGSLGNVMKESAHAAISYIRSRCEEFGIDCSFYKTKDIHIHVPEGAVPKDGPSAGITITTALLSALTDTPVRRDVAMTGEITLRGRVLAIGGLREKTMAAYRAGIKTILIPQDNAPDISELEPVIIENIRFIPAQSYHTVLEHAFAAPLQRKQEPQMLPLAAESIAQQTVC